MFHGSVARSDGMINKLLLHNKETCLRMVANEISMHAYSRTIIKTSTTTLPNLACFVCEGKRNG